MIGVMRLTVVARKLPARGRTHVGLQVRRDAVGLVPAGTPEARWTTEIEAVERDGERDFRGPAVQGKRGERFVYLTYGEVAAGGEYTMRGRAKIMLDDAPDAAAVAVTVEVTDEHGKVRTARLRPPVAMWTVD